MSPPDPFAEEHTRRFRRTRSGCQTCRERRVKCDEAKPVCGNCAKLAASCSWNLGHVPSDDTPWSTDNAPTRKRRKPIRRLPTCIPCQLAKSRCSHTPPSCERCIAHGRQCTWPEAVTPPDHPITPAPSNGPDIPYPSIDPRALLSHPPAHSSSLQLDTILGPGIPLHALVDAFFTHVHPTQAMSFLHHGQLLRDIKEGSASPLLIRAICTVSLRFLDSADREHPDGGTLAAKWAEETKMWLVSDTDQVSLSRLAAMLCIIHHESNSGRLLSAWQWVALAARMALAMGLDSSRFMAHSSCPWVTREIARRLMWSTVSADALGSSAHAKYRLLQSDLDLDLPANEHSFKMGQCPETSQRLSDQVSGGFMASWVRLMLLRRTVLSYACYGHQEPLKPWEKGSTFHTLEDQLDQWHDSLPPDMCFTVDNLYIRHSSAEMGSLAGLHLLYDLVRISLLRVGVSAVAFDGPGDALYPEMPLEFTRSCHRKAYNVGLAVRDRLRAIENHFPDYTSSSRLWIRSVHASLRIQIEYQEISEPAYVELLDGFRTMVGTVAKMTRYFSADRKTVRDLLDMLAQHGYSLYTEIDEAAIGTRCGTPSIPHHHTGASGDGQILSDIPWVRRSIKEPHVMDVGGTMRDKTRDLPPASVSALRESLDGLDYSDSSMLLARPPSDFLLPASSNEQDLEFSLWTHFQPEPQQTVVPDLESLFGLPQNWS